MRTSWIEHAQPVVEHLLVDARAASSIGCITDTQSLILIRAPRSHYRSRLGVQFAGMPEWKDTVNLPRTGFPMKANLQTAEPEAIARWDAMNLYGQIREKRRGAPKFVFHDGPPYANAQIHLGTALNKILKDIVIKSRTMAGFDVPYMPGYDCHGLPIELKVDRELGPKKRDMSISDIRRACREYAGRYIDVMTAEFKRLMVFGDWDHYYVTMNPRYQADIARALGKFVERGLVYKGKKPVHWCIHCRTALAGSGSRVRGSFVAVDLRRVPAGAGERGGSGRARARARRTRRLGADLDDDAVDDSVEPGDRVSSGVRLRGVRRGRPRGDRRRAARAKRSAKPSGAVRPARSRG